MENYTSALEGSDLTQALPETDVRILIFSADTLTLLTTSEAIKNELHYTPVALRSMSITDLLDQRQEDKLRDILSNMQVDGVGDNCLKTTLRRFDGTKLPVALRLCRMQLFDKPVIVATAELPHAKGHANGSIREQRLENVTAQVPALLFQMRQGPNELIQFSFLSQSCENLLGLAPEILYANARQFFALIVDEDRESWATQLRESAEKLEVLYWEGQIRIPSWKDMKWISLRAKPEDDGDNGIQWTGVMTNVSQSKASEVALRQSRADLSDLYVHLDRAQEEEHAHLRHAVHDDLGGNLSALKMMLSHLWESIPDTDKFAPQKSYLDKIISRSIRSIQQIATELRPGILDAGLVAALEWLTAEQENQTGIHYAFRCNAAEIPMDPALATPLFRIAQAACANIREYAQASAAEIHLYDGCSELLMEIIDNGKGNLTSSQTNLLNYRLREMRERIALLGGSFSMATRPGKGTLISLHVPLPQTYEIGE